MINALNISSIFLYLLFAFVIFKNNRYWPLFLFFYIGQLWTILSSYYIEQGIYITEQARSSFETGATYRLVFANLIFFSASIVLLKFFKKENFEKMIKTQFDIKLSKVILLSCFVLSLIYIIDPIVTRAKYGVVFNKFTYFEYSVLYDVPLLGFLFSHISFIVFMLGYFLMYFKGSRKLIYIAILSFLFILIASILQGNKFTALYLNLILFLIPILTTIKMSINKKLLKKATYFLVLLTVFLILVIKLSINEYSEFVGKEEAGNFVLYRIFGLQGHVWWGTDYLSTQLTDYQKEKNLQNEINVILLKEEGKYTSGLNALMLFISPQIGASYIENGVSFTMGFPAINQTLFNPFSSFIVLIGMGIFFGIFIHYLYTSIVHKKFIPAFLLGYIYIYGVIQFFTMGRTSSLFNLKIYLVVFLLFYLKIVILGIKKQNRYSKGSTRFI